MGWLVFATLAAALVFSVPIGIALGLAAMAGILYLDPAFLPALPQKVLAGLDSFPLLAVPLFILAGTIMGHGGIARRIVNLAMVFVGQVRGGLGLVVILSTMFFSRDLGLIERRHRGHRIAHAPGNEAQALP